MKHFVQCNNIRIQFLLNRVSKLVGFVLNWKKSSFTEIKNVYYDQMPVWGECLGNVYFLKLYLWKTTCDCLPVTLIIWPTHICSIQPAVFTLHPFPISADLQDLVLCNSQHYITEFSGPDHISTSLREMFVPWARRLELTSVNKGAECWPKAVLWGNKFTRNIREQGDFLSPSPLCSSLG